MFLFKIHLKVSECHRRTGERKGFAMPASDFHTWYSINLNPILMTPFFGFQVLAQILQCPEVLLAYDLFSCVLWKIPTVVWPQRSHVSALYFGDSQSSSFWRLNIHFTQPFAGRRFSPHAPYWSPNKLQVAQRPFLFQTDQFTPGWNFVPVMRKSGCGDPP